MPAADLHLISTLTLATSGADGEPHVAPVYFAASGPFLPAPASGLAIFFFSDPNSQHAQDLERDPRAAAAVYLESQDWQDICGLQMQGDARPAQPGAAWEQAWNLYRAKFPFVDGLKAIVARNTLYCFTPHWVRL
ncbi:MAG TPA: pyridoxamine 5'-phosphate oxidase family protein, partial [Anaerolineales bacterium]